MVTAQDAAAAIIVVVRADVVDVVVAVFVVVVVWLSTLKTEVALYPEPRKYLFNFVGSTSPTKLDRNNLEKVHMSCIRMRV